MYLYLNKSRGGLQLANSEHLGDKNTCDMPSKHPETGILESVLDSLPFTTCFSVFKYYLN